MNLLRDIQSDAVSDDSSITNLLRKCKILAARLGNEEFDRWVHKELNGYQENEELPEYRTLRYVESRGYFSGYMGSALKNAPIPHSCIDKRFRKDLTEHLFMDGIGIYEDLLRKDNDGFSVNWPSDIVALHDEKFYENMSCISAWKIISRGSIKNVIDSVRNKILTFALEIEKLNPEAGEAPIDSSPVPQTDVSHVFHTVIYGNVGNIASGNENVSQKSILVDKGDWASLKSEFKKIGLEEEDINLFKKAIEEDNVEKNKKIGQKTSSWLSKIIVKAANGGLKISVAVASQILPKLICNYFGIPIA